MSREGGWGIFQEVDTPCFVLIIPLCFPSNFMLVTSMNTKSGLDSGIPLRNCWRRGTRRWSNIVHLRLMALERLADVDKIKIIKLQSQALRNLSKIRSRLSPTIRAILELCDLGCVRLNSAATRAGKRLQL